MFSPTGLRDVGTDWELSQLIVTFVKSLGGNNGIVWQTSSPDSAQTIDGTGLDWLEAVYGGDGGGRTGGIRETIRGRRRLKLVIKLLEVTHGQWIFRNLMVHDSILGVLVTRDKEELQVEIEKQKELGGEGLAEQDKWMLEVNLADLEKMTGESQYYWLVAVQAAREAYNLRHQRRQLTRGADITDHGGEVIS